MTDTIAGYEFKNNNRGVPVEALNQSSTWFDQNGKEHRITEMNRKHAEACLNKIVKWHGLNAKNTPLFEAMSNQAFGRHSN